jgi:hypothetical protein
MGGGFWHTIRSPPQRSELDMEANIDCWSFKSTKRLSPVLLQPSVPCHDMTSIIWDQSVPNKLFLIIVALKWDNVSESYRLLSLRAHRGSNTLSNYENCSPTVILGYEHLFWFQALDRNSSLLLILDMVLKLWIIAHVAFYTFRRTLFSNIHSMWSGSSQKIFRAFRSRRIGFGRFGIYAMSGEFHFFPFWASMYFHIRIWDELSFDIRYELGFSRAEHNFLRVCQRRKAINAMKCCEENIINQWLSFPWGDFPKKIWRRATENCLWKSIN